MTKYIGRRVEAAIGIEATRGLGVVPAYSLGKVEFSHYDKVDEARDEESLGNIADSAGKYITEKYAMGVISGNLGANTAAYLLTLLLGASPSIASVSDSTYTHTFTPANTNTHKSASLYVKDANQTQQHKLVMLNSLEISSELEEMLNFTAEFVSKRGVTSTQSFPSYVEDYKLVKRKAKIFLASSVAGLGAATRLSVKSFNITFNKNATRDGSLGTVEPEDILNGPLSIEGELKLNYNDQTYRALMNNGTYNALRLQVLSEKLPGSTTYPKITIDLPKVDFFGWEPDSGNDDIQVQTINFKANYDLTSGQVTNASAITTLASL